MTMSSCFIIYISCVLLQRQRGAVVPGKKGTGASQATRSDMIITPNELLSDYYYGINIWSFYTPLHIFNLPCRTLHKMPLCEGRYKQTGEYSSFL